MSNWVPKSIHQKAYQKMEFLNLLKDIPKAQFIKKKKEKKTEQEIKDFRAERETERDLERALRAYFFEDSPTPFASTESGDLSSSSS